jgi:hypothetical protein
MMLVNSIDSLTLRTLEVQGDGIYRQVLSLAKYVFPYAAGDFDGDGKSEIVGQLSFSIDILESASTASDPSTPSWSSPPLSNIIGFATVADTDRDGSRILTPSMIEPSPHGIHTHLQIGDLNMNGRPEIFWLANTNTFASSLVLEHPGASPADAVPLGWQSRRLEAIPNPVRTRASLHLAAQAPTTHRLTVLDAAGRLVQCQILPHEATRTSSGAHSPRPLASTSCDSKTTPAAPSPPAAPPSSAEFRQRGVERCDDAVRHATMRSEKWS